MKLLKGRGFKHSGIFALLLFIIILIVLVLVFSQQILSNISKLSSSANLIALLVAIIFPLILLIVILYNIINLIRERTQKKPGVHLKIKLVLFFALIAFLASGPQALLSINFIKSSINFWLKAGIGDALRGGLSISLDYYQSKVDNLKMFNKSRAIPMLFNGITKNPDSVWENIRNINPEISFVQIYNDEGNEVFFRGDKNGKLKDFAAVHNRTGILPKVEKQDISILRSIGKHTIDGKTYTVIAGIILPAYFNKNASNLTNSLETFNQLNKYNRLFIYAVSIFYFLFTLPILLLVILLSFILTDELLRPIVDLENATRRVAEGDFSFRILSRSEDELAILISSFNKMIGELSTSREKLVHAEKIAAWQDIAQRLAHEIRNPLTPIKLSAQRILKKYKSNPEDLKNILENSVTAIVNEVDNLDKLLKEFREFAKLPNPHPVMVNVKEVVEEIAGMFRSLGESITIETNGISDKITVKADPAQIKQIFSNLFRNAIQSIDESMRTQGVISVIADIVKKEDIQYCRIQIRDNGSGIDEEYKDKIFNPYFTTKKQGTGLGLSIVERIVFDHNGHIWFESKKGVGTTFFIDLPHGEING
ncbi:MAG: hypothetical protein DRP57_00120 [Spirochaetes bacterium]|nr:MAG: hypothetical protein DRP57_00120 [Spirochaetota bacterium]